MKKITIYVLILVVIIALGIIVAVNLKNDDKSIPSSSENIKENQTENLEGNTTNKVENDIDENVTSNVEEENQNREEQTPKTDVEKAIDIVKKDWGEDNSVYFAEDGKTQEGEYIICVRDSNTTAAIAWYTVNVRNR